MDYIKIRFINDFDQLDPKFEKTIDDMFRPIRPMFMLSEQKWKPQMDIYETPDQILILAEIAGVNKEDLELEISNKAVRIYGTRSRFPRRENAKYRLAEIQYGRFERILIFPHPLILKWFQRHIQTVFSRFDSPNFHWIKLPKIQTITEG